MSSAKKKKSESELLAEETLKMEAKLRALKAEMTRQRLEADVPRTNSGSRWRAGGSEFGSVTRYDKDVNEKLSQKSLQPPPMKDKKTDSTVNPTATRPQARPGSSRRPLKPEEAASWTVDDVKRWLSNLGLDAYAPQFTENAISGEVLLELGTEDLDYMKITALGHRKLLLKGVEQLRIAVNPPAAIDVPMKLAPTTTSKPKTTTNSSNTGTETQTGSGGGGGGGGGSLWSNPFGPLPGDSSGGGGDEVLNAIRGLTLEEDPQTLGSTRAGGGGGTSLWDGEYDEEAERRAFQAAVQAWRTSGKTETTASNADDNKLPEPSGPGGALLQGNIDEEAEHRAFQEAVNAWRSNSTKPGFAMPGNRVSCYTCFKVFLPNGGEFEVSGKQLCSAACQAAYTTQLEERNKRAEELSRQAREVQSSRGVTERKTIDDDDDSGKQDDDDGVAFGEGVSSWGTGTDSMASLPSGTQTSGLGQSNGNSNTAGYTPRDYSDIWATNVEF